MKTLLGALCCALFFPVLAATRVPYQPVTDPLLNIDFGAHLNSGLPKGTGPLAIGKGPDDRWNVYSRDGASMNDFLSDNILTNLVWSDGAPSSVFLDVKNAPGAWSTLPHHEPMFYSYLYPTAGSQIQLELSHLPAGHYDVYFYSHAEVPTGNSLIALATTSQPYGEKATGTGDDWDAQFYAEGQHYVRFAEVLITEGETLKIVVKPGSYGQAFMNAMQLVWKSGTTPPVALPSTSDLFDVSQGAVVTRHSGVWPTSEIEAMFGSTNPGVEPGYTVFQDHQPDGFVHFVEWRTQEPVLLSSFRLFAAGDGPTVNYEREFSSFVFKAKTPGSESFDKVLYTLVPSHPYDLLNLSTLLLVDTSIEPLVAQEFRAEFVQRNAGWGYDAPRVVELDGFGVNSTNHPVIISEPESLAIPAGESASFAVETHGAEPMLIQWFYNGAPIPAGTNRALILTNVQLAQAGTYTVRASNDEGSARSRGAVLDVTNNIPGGTVNFANLINGLLNAPITDPAGARLVGPEFLAQLYAGASQSSLTAVGAAVPFGTGEQAGYFQAASRVIPNTEPGAAGVLEVRAWTATAGTSYESAVENGGPHGRSGAFAVLLGGAERPPANLLGLTGFSLVARPAITRQPASLSVLEDQLLALSVEATGGNLSYQWFFNDAPLPNAVSATLSFPSASLTNAGTYAVEVRNAAGKVFSVPAEVIVREADRQAPVVAISSPLSGATTADRITITGTAADNVGVIRVEIERNRQFVGTASLQNGAFSIPNLLLVRGTNSIVIRARDAAGNIGSASITLVLLGERALSLADLGAVQEGSLIEMPVTIRSSGEISAVTFTILYPPGNLANPELIWASEPAGVLAQVNTNTSGQVRASFALAGATIPAGTNLLATVQFRVRSVPGPLLVTNRLQLQGFYGANGNLLPARNDLFGGSLFVTKRRFVGDNNANDRLDVADASAIMRFITLLEQPQPWDITGNDLNANAQLDAGDLIRVLRTVVALDPQPGGVPGLLSSLSLPQSSEKLALSSDRSTLVAGETLTVRLALEGRARPLAGASFRVLYPPNALKLEGASSIRSGSAVPSGALALWNLSPAQNDFALQDGVFQYAVSSAAAWSASNGEILELSFAVQPSALLQPFWNITVNQADLSDGWILSEIGSQTLPLPVAGFGPSLAARLAGGGEFQLSGSGVAGAAYQIEASANLREWATLGSRVTASANGEFSYIDQSNEPARYYRAVRID